MARSSQAAVRASVSRAIRLARGVVHTACGHNLDCVDVDKVAPSARGRAATRRRAGVPSAD